MKICFLIPPPMNGKLPAERIFGCNYGIYKMPNIFLLYPATILKNAGHKVEILDFVADKKSYEVFLSFTKNQDFDVIVFSTVFLSVETDIKAKEILQKNNTKSSFIFISSLPTAEPEKFVSRNSIVVRGEPEPVIEEIINRIESRKSFDGISGVSFLKDGKVLHADTAKLVEDLDLLPIPDRSMLSISKYMSPKFSRQPFTTIISSRGCAYRCKFCVPNSLSFAREIEYKRNNCNKPPIRRRSNANILKELEQIYNEGYRSFTFIDDQFVWNDQETIDLCKSMEKYGFEWSCLVRADRLQNIDVVLAMRKAGCVSIDIGVESFNQEILNDIQKDCTVEQIENAILNVKKANISPKLNMLVAASPMETEDTIEETFQSILKHNLDIVMISICTPFPYTEFNKLAKSNNWMIKDEYVGINPMKESYINYPHLSKHRVEVIVRKMYRRFYLRPSYLFKQLKKVVSFKDFVNKAKAAILIFTGK